METSQELLKLIEEIGSGKNILSLSEFREEENLNILVALGKVWPTVNMRYESLKWLKAEMDKKGFKINKIFLSVPFDTPQDILDDLKNPKWCLDSNLIVLKAQEGSRAVLKEAAENVAEDMKTNEDASKVVVLTGAGFEKRATEDCKTVLGDYYGEVCSQFISQTESARYFGYDLKKENEHRLWVASALNLLVARSFNLEFESWEKRRISDKDF